jgi:hypothetical protein
MACRIGKIEAKIILLLLDAYPQGAAEMDHKGHLPLHLLLKHHNTVPMDVVKRLFEINPKGLPDGMTSVLDEVFHWRTNYKGRVGVVKSLLEKCPEQASHKSSDGLPIHTACKVNTMYPEALLQLLSAYPQGAKEPDSKGVLPLDLLVEHVSDPEVVMNRLLELYPQSLQHRSNSGELTL